MLAKDIKPGMIIREGKKALRVLETPFPCSRFTKVHITVEKTTAEGKKRETGCYDRMGEVDRFIFARPVNAE